jgi:hypothetical protein
VKKFVLISAVAGALVALVRYAYHFMQVASSASGIEQNQERLAGEKEPPASEPLNKQLDMTNKAARGYRSQLQSIAKNASKIAGRSGS